VSCVGEAVGLVRVNISLTALCVRDCGIVARFDDY
jgi:hypothetical protein